MSDSHPRAGLKVLELARILARPWAGQVLADLGAEITNIESPAGDDTRTWGPPFISNPDGSRDAAYNRACNRGKSSVVIDLAMLQLEQALNDPQVIAHKKVVARARIAGLRTPFRFSDTTLALGRDASQLGKRQP